MRDGRVEDAEEVLERALERARRLGLTAPTDFEADNPALA